MTDWPLRRAAGWLLMLTSTPTALVAGWAILGLHTSVIAIAILAAAVAGSVVGGWLAPLSPVPRRPLPRCCAIARYAATPWHQCDPT